MEAGLLGTSDYLSNTIWAQNFMSVQGYPIKYNYFAEDSENTMKLAQWFHLYMSILLPY